MDRETMDPSQGEKTTMDREIGSKGERTKDLIRKAGEKTTMDREIGSKGERTKDLIRKAKGFLENHFSIWAEAAKEVLGEEAAEKKNELADLYREDSWMNFDGENIQGKEAIRAKLTSLKPSRIQVLNIECLPVGGTGFVSGTGFSSDLQGVACGYIWLNGKQDACFFSQTFFLHPTPEGSFAISNSIFIHKGMES